MNITINLITNLQETVQNTVLSKILAAKRNNETINLTGNIYIPAAYANEVLEFCTYFGLTEDENSPGTYRGNNIILSIGTSYISFQDNEVARIVNGTFGADGHTTLQQAADAVFTSSTFKNNTTITAFPEFDLFTKANINPPDDLFYGCVNLEDIDMSKVSIIKANEFRDTKITDVNCPELTGISGGTCFYNCTSLRTITNLGNINTICSWCFANCTSLLTVVLPPSITVLDGLAFLIRSGSVGSITSITNLEKVTSIGEECFLNLSFLAVDIGTLTKVNTLRLSAFDYCHSIYGVINMPNLLTIGQSALRACAGITKIKCLGKISAIPPMFISKHTYSGTMALTEAYIPYECTSIEHTGFYGCSLLTTVKQYTDSIDDWIEGEEPTTGPLSRVTSFGQNCFLGCSQLLLTQLDIQNATTIGADAFNGTLLSGQIDLSNVSSIDLASFRNTKITSVNLGHNITSIPRLCFENCSNLSYIYGLENVTYISSYFANNSRLFSSMDVLHFDNVTSCDSAITNWDSWNTSYPCHMYFPKLTTMPGSYSRNDTYHNGFFTDRGGFGCSFVYFRDISVVKPGTFSFAYIKSFVINNTTPPSVTGIDANDTEKLLDKIFHYSQIENIYVPDESISAYQNSDFLSSYLLNGYTKNNVLMYPQLRGMSELTHYATEADWVAAGKPVDGIIEEYM